MANTTITNLPLAVALNGTEQVPAVQSSATVRLTTAQIATYTIGQIPATSIAIGTAITGSTVGYGLYVNNFNQLDQFSYGTGVRTALGVNIGSAGAPVLFNGAGGTPSSLTLTNATALPITGITATGTPSVTTYLRGDGAWAAVATGTVTSVSVTTANGVSGTVANATSTPAISLTLGTITPTSVNGLTLAAAATGFTIAGGTTSKTLTVSNTLTLAGTDASTLNIGAGGTLGSLAFLSAAPAGTLSGTTLNATVVTSSLTSVGTIGTGVWQGTAVGILYGGTGQTTATAGFNALSPVTTTGDLIVGNGTNSSTRLAIGSTSQVLTVVGGTAAWANSTSSGTVTSVSVTTANGVSGTVANATSTPAISLTLGTITPTSVNGLTLTAAATGFTIAGGTTSKTLTVSNTLTLAGTDSSTLNIGAGGTLGSLAFLSAAPAGTLSGTTLNATVVTSSLTSVGTIGTGVWQGTAVGILYGGTGQTTATAGFNALSPVTTTGDLIVGNGTNSSTRLAIGSTSQVLTVVGGTAAWAAAATGTVTSVSVTTANGVSGTVATSTTTPAISLTLGAITPTSVNGLTLVAASTGFTVAGGTTSKTLTVSNTLALAGTDSTTMTFPPASASIGYLNIPQNSQSGNYTLVLADSGKHIYTTALATITIPAESSVNFAIGTAVTFVNSSASAMTIAITTDTMRLSPAGTTGSRTLAQYGIATAIKVASAVWYISGSGLT